MNRIAQARISLFLLTLSVWLGLFGVASQTSLADDPKVLSFDDIKFPMELNDEFVMSLLTPEVTALENQRIQIRGFIRPSVKQDGIQKFILVRDNLECCFGPGAMLYDCMIVRLTSGEETSFTTRPITVEGTFYIKEFRGPDDRIWAIYNLKDAQIK